MSSRKKKIWVGVTILVVVVGVGIWWFARRSGPEQFITLASGEKYRFVGVTYGLKAEPPSTLARLFHRLPKSWTDFVARHAAKYAGGLIYNDATFGSDAPRLYLWFRKVGSTPNWGASLVAKLADENGVEGGTDDQGVPALDGNWAFAFFYAVPRRTPVIECHFYTQNGGGGWSGSKKVPPMMVGKLKFRNPFFGSYPQWQAESVPVTKQAGQVKVRLDHFGIGSGVSGLSPVLANGKYGMGYEPASPGVGVSSYFDVAFETNSNDAWVVQAAELSDATGSALFGDSQLSSSQFRLISPMTYQGEYRLRIGGTLWPDEEAWKLKLWVKRKNNIPKDEFVVFKNVPALPTGSTNFRLIKNFKPIKMTVNGVEVVLTDFLPNVPPNVVVGDVQSSFPTYLRVETPEGRDDVAVDFVSLTTDTGVNLEPKISEWGHRSRTIRFDIFPTNAHTVDITWTVQKMRTVEFLVKPMGNESPKSKVQSPK